MKLSVVMSIVITLLFFCVCLVLWIHYYCRRRRRRSKSSSKTPLEQAFPKITPASDHIHGGDASTMNMSEEEEDRRTVERRIIHIRDGSAGLPGSSSGTSISSGSEAAKINPSTNALRFCNNRAADASSFSAAAESSSYFSSPDASHSAWGRCYALNDLDLATDSFSESKVVGRGGYGIVYHGILRDGTPIAVKRLVNNRFVCADIALVVVPLNRHLLLGHAILRVSELAMCGRNAKAKEEWGRGSNVSACLFVCVSVC
jgi:hypothetical protein